jgi:hypothetical protein
MTELEFRRVYDFRLAYDLLMGFTAPRSSGFGDPDTAIDTDSDFYTQARDRLVWLILSPYGLTARTPPHALTELYDMYDEELLAELLELRDIAREAARLRRQQQEGVVPGRPFAPPQSSPDHRREEIMRTEVQIRRGHQLPTRGQPQPPVAADTIDVWVTNANTGEMERARRAVPQVSAVDADYVNPRTRAGRIARINRQIRSLEEEHEEDYLLPPAERQRRAGEMVDRLTEFAQQLEDLGHDSSKMKKKQSKTKKVVERAKPEPKPKVIKRRLSVGRKRPSVPPHDE